MHGIQIENDHRSYRVDSQCNGHVYQYAFNTQIRCKNLAHKAPVQGVANRSLPEAYIARRRLQPELGLDRRAMSVARKTSSVQSGHIYHAHLKHIENSGGSVDSHPIHIKDEWGGSCSGSYRLFR